MVTFSARFFTIVFINPDINIIIMIIIIIIIIIVVVVVVIVVIIIIKKCNTSANFTS